MRRRFDSLNKWFGGGEQTGEDVFGFLLAIGTQLSDYKVVNSFALAGIPSSQLIDLRPCARQKEKEPEAPPA